MRALNKSPWVVVGIVAIALAVCAAVWLTSGEMTPRERAIEISRSSENVSWLLGNYPLISVNAELADENLWKVTWTGRDLSKPYPSIAAVILDIDVRTGEILKEETFVTI